MTAVRIFRHFHRPTVLLGCFCMLRRCPRAYGIGDVGPVAIAWIDQLCDAGQSWWQALPLGPTGYGNSPYQSLSSFAGNGLLISPDWLIEDGLLSASDCQAPSFSSSAVDYNTGYPVQIPIA